MARFKSDAIRGYQFPNELACREYVTRQELQNLHEELVSPESRVEEGDLYKWPEEALGEKNLQAIG